MKKLPIGLSSFSEIRENNYLYVDKTPFIASLDEQKYYFLSRPRRFGKTLLLDTIAQAYLGKKDLFKGLYLENNWNWQQSHPIIKISFSSGSFSTEGELDMRIKEILSSYARECKITLEATTHGGQLGELILKLQQKYAHNVVILIDEYDKPILDAIDNDVLAVKNREILKGLYGTLKDFDSSLKLVFITGVTKFAKAGIFSNLNNLEDITFHRKYADICGYTQNDIETTFKDYLHDVDFTELKSWYNGYNFLGNEAQKVYNPFDILLFIDKGKVYKNYWFETGTPSFLIKLLQKNQYYFPNLEAAFVKDDSLSSFDVENLSLITLLFQAGYLTIKEEVKVGTQIGYILSYPNLEVKASINDQLAAIGTKLEIKDANISRLAKCLLQTDLDELPDIFRSYFASIPNDWYRNNNIQDYEGFYASIVYSYFCALGYDVIAEDATNTARIDLTVELPDKILILEFKLLKNGDAISALKQIKDKKYADKYKTRGKPIHLMGVSFDHETRNIHDFLIEKL